MKKQGKNIFKDSANVVIHGYADSLAEEIAKENKLEFINLD